MYLRKTNNVLNFTNFANNKKNGQIFNSTNFFNLTTKKRFYSSDSPHHPSQKKTKTCEVVVVTSGKGGVGKTTTAASLALGLANLGYRTCAIDFDIGLRNLDIHFGMERRIIYDFVNVINGDAKLTQALVKDKVNANMSMLAASQTKDKTVLTEEGVERVLSELRELCDFVICDSPAGIESGAYHAMLFADKAVICTNPELSSIKDSDKMIGFISSKSRRALEERAPVQQSLLVTRYNPLRAQNNEMIHLKDIRDLLGLPLLGVIPESNEVLHYTNLGKPVLSGTGEAAMAYQDAVRRLIGEEVPLRFTEVESKKKGGFFSNLFSRT